MGEDQAPGPGGRRGGARVLGGVVDLGAVGRRPGALRLAEQRGAVRGEFGEGRTGGGVARVHQRGAAGRHPEREGRDVVRDRAGGQFESADGRPVAVRQLGDGEGGFDRAAGAGVGEEAGQPVRGAGRAEQRDRGGRAEVRVQQAVVRGEQVRAVVGVQVRDPDRIELVQPDVPLQGPERPAAGVHPDPGAAARHQVAGAGVVDARVGRGAAQDGEVERSVGHPGILGRTPT